MFACKLQWNNSNKKRVFTLKRLMLKDISFISTSDKPLNTEGGVCILTMQHLLCKKEKAVSMFRMAVVYYFKTLLKIVKPSFNKLH